MLKIKTFKLGTDSDDEINKFINSVDTLEDGLKFCLDGVLAIKYVDKGLNGTKEYYVERAKERLASVMAERVQAELNLIKARREADAKRGGVAKQHATLQFVSDCEANIEGKEEEILVQTKLIEDIENDRLPLTYEAVMAKRAAEENQVAAA